MSAWHVQDPTNTFSSPESARDPRSNLADLCHLKMFRLASPSLPKESGGSKRCHPTLSSSQCAFSAISRVNHSLTTLWCVQKKTPLNFETVTCFCKLKLTEKRTRDRVFGSSLIDPTFDIRVVCYVRHIFIMPLSSSDRCQDHHC